MTALIKNSGEDNPTDGMEDFLVTKNPEESHASQAGKDKTLERLYPILDGKISPLVSNKQNMKEIFEQNKEAIFNEFLASGILPEGELWEYMQDNMRDFYTCAFGYGFRFLDKWSGEDGTILSQTDAMNVLIQQVAEAIIHKFTPKRLYKEYNFCIRYAPFMLSQLNFLIHLKYIRLTGKQELHHFLGEFLPDNFSTLSDITSCLDWLSNIIGHHYIPGGENTIALEILNEKRKNIANSSQSAFVHFLMKNYSKNNSSLNICISKKSYEYFGGRILNGYKPGEFHEITLNKKYIDNLDDEGKRETLIYEDFIPVPIIKISTDRALKLDSTLKTPYSFYYIDDNGDLKEGGEHGKLFDNYDFPPESKEDYQYLIQLLHRPDILFHIETALGIEFSDYPFSIQPPFLQFLAYATLEDFARVREFLEKSDNIMDKYYRLRLFLATAEKPNKNKPDETPIAEVILELEGKLIETYSRENKVNGEQAGKERVQLIFKKYSDVMNIIEKEAQEIQDSLIAHDANVTFSKQEFARNLLGRANNTILRDFYKEVERGSPESIEKLFGKCQADLLQFGSLFRSITVHAPGDTLDTILSSYKVKREIVNGVDLVTKNKENIIKGLYQRNYRDRPDFEEVMRLVHDDFEKDKKDINTEYSFFYYTTGEDREDSVGRDQGKPILAVKFTKQPDGTIYAGGLNSEPMLLQSSFGIYTFRLLLQEYNDKVVTGKVAKDSKKLLREYGKLGFESDEILHTDESGLECYDIIRPVQKK